MPAGRSGLFPGSSEGVESRGLSARFSCPPGPPLPLPLFSAVQIPYPLDFFFNAIVEGLNQRKTREPPESAVGGRAFFLELPMVPSRMFQRIFPTLERWQAPSVCGRLKTPGRPYCPRKPEQQGHTLCLSPEGRAGRAVSVQTLALSCRVAPVLRRGRQAGAGGGGRGAHPLPQRLAGPSRSSQRPPLGEAAERGSQLAEPLGTFCLWDAGGGGLALVWTPGRPSWGCCPHGVTRGPHLATVPPVLCICSFHGIHPFRTVLWGSTSCQGLASPAKAHRTNRKIRPCGADFLTRGDRQ